MAKKEKIKYPNPEFWKCRDEIQWGAQWENLKEFGGIAWDLLKKTDWKQFGTDRINDVKADGQRIKEEFTDFMALDKAEKIDRSSRELSLRRTVSSACVVTWFNPQAIIDGSLMLGAFHVTLPAAEATTFISGVASASCLWFMGLTLVLSIFRGKFSEKVLRSINILCGAVILLYGAKLLYHFLILTLG